MDKIERRIGGEDPLSVTGYVEAPLAYDAVWSLAYALNRTQNMLGSHGCIGGEGSGCGGDGVCRGNALWRF